MVTVTRRCHLPISSGMRVGTALSIYSKTFPSQPWNPCLWEHVAMGMGTCMLVRSHASTWKRHTAVAIPSASFSDVTDGWRTPGDMQHDRTSRSTCHIICLHSNANARRNLLSPTPSSNPNQTGNRERDNSRGHASTRNEPASSRSRHRGGAQVMGVCRRQRPFSMELKVWASILNALRSEESLRSTNQLLRMRVQGSARNTGSR